MALQSCDLHVYSVRREELLTRGSAMHMHHLLVMLSVEFADAVTAQMAYYRRNINNHQYITICVMYVQYTQ